MVLDTLTQADRYAMLSPRLARAFAYLRSFSPETAVGRQEICAEEIDASGQRHATKPIAERLYEAHRRYLDIQYIHPGRELIYWAPLASRTTVTRAYGEKGDVALFAVIPDGTPVPVTTGQFVIFWPQDGHAPSCAWGEPAEVGKVVVKVLICGSPER